MQDVFAEIGGFGSIVLIIAKFINYAVSSFNMVYDTLKLMPFTSCPLENNKTFNENMRKSEPVTRPFKLENLNKKREEIKHIRLYNHERNVKKVMNDELSEEGKDESNKLKE